MNLKCGEVRGTRGGLLAVKVTKGEGTTDPSFPAQVAHGSTGLLVPFLSLCRLSM